MSADSTSTPSPAPEVETSRRGLLALAGAGGAAAAAGLLADRAGAGHDATNVFHLGEFNTNPSDPTALTAAADGPALAINASDSTGEALQVGGHTNLFSEITPEQGDTLFVSNNIDGGGAISASIPGSEVEDQGNHAVEGVVLGTFGVGVIGVAGEGEDYGNGAADGVVGTSGSGKGVTGISTTGVAVEARCGVEGDSLDGIALLVQGRPHFSTAGNAVIATGQNNAFVANPAVTEESHISVTFHGNPGARVFKWVERDPGNGFTVRCTSRLGSSRPETPFSYLIVEPSE
jgi:hypothetical protein